MVPQCKIKKFCRSLRLIKQKNTKLSNLVAYRG